MADTKWLDPTDWDLSDWLDTEQTVLISHLWETLRGAANERVAFVESSHDSGFPETDTFPDLEDAVFDSSVGTTRAAIRIANAIYPKNAVDADSIHTSGTASSNTDIPEDFTLADLLTDEFGYPSGTLLHLTDTDQGRQPAIPLMSWVKQWYEVLDYPTYYNFDIDGNTYSDRFSVIEQQQIVFTLTYSWHGPDDPTEPDTLVFAAASVNGNSVYETDDLNETAPFSTPQEVRDYAITKIEDALDDVAWNSLKGSGSTGYGKNQSFGVSMHEQTTYSINATPRHQLYIDVDVTIRRLRFKVADEYRATSPNKFTADVYWNGFHRYGSNPSAGVGAHSTFEAFGTGKTEDEIEFTKLTPDVDGYYYLPITDLSSFDFDVWTALAVPSAPSTPPYNVSNINSQGGSFVVNSLSVDMTDYDDIHHSIYINPNKDDGTLWEYYTPPPP